VSSSQIPLSAAQRSRALLRGTAALAGAVALLVGVGWLAAALRLDDRWTIQLLRIALLGADAALVGAAWQLGRARDRRLDARGWVALALALVAWPLLVLFVVWTAIAAWVWITGRPFQPYGN